MDSSLLMAAQWQALNARYLAEGFNTFNFNSGGVDLQFDRTQYIATKMEEIENALQTVLAGAKAAAVRQFGPGVPAAGVSGTGSIGSLGISVSPVLNRRARIGIGFGISGRSSIFN